ncbi:hypothetical protein CERSUDRAFT_121726 [Gelatoporia subvermispora B]|uniref:A-kinase anchor protein 7-like phosphoesterase domain-containing protein n=1 Tax=Ceriporiopsis subvermispora (strain B) TaxID=914234 RepID=M2PS48_CERS8|nr:hypothetical protein CERSUDRAFT_121726 [Gelatoporia subvermispora B]
MVGEEDGEVDEAVAVEANVGEVEVEAEVEAEMGGTILGHHAALRERMTTFTDALLQTSPAITGLDRSIVIPPRRLHLTLGVLSLDTQKSSSSRSARPSARAAPVNVSSVQSGASTSTKPSVTAQANPIVCPRTLDAVRTLLQGLRPRILEILGREPLRVRLGSMDVMKPERGDLERAHVMWVGPPPEGEDVRRLKAVAQFVHDAFKKEGLLVDEGRALKLHCTVLNTVHRKPRSRNRVPFSYAAILSSPALDAVTTSDMAEPLLEGDSRIRLQSQTSSQSRPRRPTRMRAVELGEWSIDEIQLCEMGSWGPEGEYVCVASCPLI